MNRTSIDWAQYSWNPVTGCQHGCDYCYAKRIAARFGADLYYENTMRPDRPRIHYIRHNVEHEFRDKLDDWRLLGASDADEPMKPYPFQFEPTFHEYRLSEPLWVKKPSRIFVCSMADLFGDWIPDEWINQVLAACEAAPQHQYLFLTKNPARYESLFIYQKKVAPHPNWWLGATFDTANDTSTYRDHLWPLHESGWHTWASAEPLLEDITENMEWEDTIDWLVIGAMTGPGSKNRQPKGEWVENLTHQAIAHGVPVFHKQSLASVMPPDLIQWYPKAMEVSK